jgi:putative peptidoglycan lipid II flippase
MSEKRRIARAAGVVGALTVLSRVSGLARDVVVGYLFGAGTGADAFFVAYRIPNLLRRLVAEGAATAAFIPIFTGTLATRGRAEADATGRVLGTTMGAVLAAITVLGVLLAGPLVRLFAPGFAATEGKLELTVALTRLCFPYIFCIGMVAAAMGILNSLRHFAAPALSPVVMNLVMLATAAALTPWLGVYSLAAGVLLGGAAQLVSQVPSLRRAGVPLAPRWEPGHPAVARFGALFLPTVFGSAVYQINVLVSTMFASLLPAGSVAYLWYAERLFEFPLGVFAVALGTAALPSFAALAKRDLGELRETLGFALRLVNLIALPAAVGLALLAEPVTAVLFQRGELTATDARQASVAVRYFALGLWSVASVRVVVPAFYALEDTRTPVAAAAIAFAVNLLAVLLTIGPLDAPPGSALGAGLAAASRALGVIELRHGGLALSTSLAATVNLVVLGLVLHRRLGGFAWGAWLASGARAAAASLAMVPAVLAVSAGGAWLEEGAALAPRLGRLLAAIGAGGAVWALALALLGGPDAAALRALVRARLARGRAG